MLPLLPRQEIVMKVAWRVADRSGVFKPVWLAEALGISVSGAGGHIKRLIEKGHMEHQSRGVYRVK